MKNRYAEEIEELILKINLLAYRISTKTKHNVFTKYYGHSNYLEVEICRNGWVYGADNDSIKIEAVLNEVTAVEELQKVIKILEDLERGEKKMEDVLVKTLKATINDLEDDLKAEKLKVAERDKLIKDYQEEHEILLKDWSKLRAKVIDLINNLDFVTDNINDMKLKEVLASDHQSVS